MNGGELDWSSSEPHRYGPMPSLPVDSSFIEYLRRYDDLRVAPVQLRIDFFAERVAEEKEFLLRAMTWLTCLVR